MKPADESPPTTRKLVLRLARQRRYQLPGGAPNKSLIADIAGVTRIRVGQILASGNKPPSRAKDRPRKSPGAPEAREQVERLAGEAQYQHQGGAPNKTLIARAAGVTRARVQQILASPEPKKRGRPRLCPPMPGEEGSYGAADLAEPAAEVAGLADLAAVAKKKRGRPRKPPAATAGE